MQLSLRASHPGNTQLKLLIAKLQRMQFGRKSEKLERRIEQLQLRLEALEMNIRANRNALN
jgi:hypothetical protein